MIKPVCVLVPIRVPIRVCPFVCPFVCTHSCAHSCAHSCVPIRACRAGRVPRGNRYIDDETMSAVVTVTLCDHFAADACRCSVCPGTVCCWRNCSNTRRNLLLDMKILRCVPSLVEFVGPARAFCVDMNEICWCTCSRVRTRVCSSG